MSATFFVTFDAAGIHIENAQSPRWEYYGEALALRQFLELHPARKVIVISTMTSAPGGARVRPRVSGCACRIPLLPGAAALRVAGKDRWFVIKEGLKLAGYAVILSTPAWAVRRLMRPEAVKAQRS